PGSRLRRHGARHRCRATGSPGRHGRRHFRRDHGPGCHLQRHTDRAVFLHHRHVLDAPAAAVPGPPGARLSHLRRPAAAAQAARGQQVRFLHPAERIPPTNFRAAISVEVAARVRRARQSCNPGVQGRAISSRDGPHRAKTSKMQIAVEDSSMSYKLSTGLLLLIAGAAQAGPLYTLSKSVPIGAPDRWDLLTFDPESHRVYIAHGDRVTVVDVPAGKVVGNVEGLSGGTHGVAVIAALHRGYTDDGKAGTANSFDLGALKVLKAIPAADDADAIAFDRVSGNLFVIDSDPGKITVIDPRTDTVRATLDGGGKLEIGVADGLGKLFVNGEAKREILR